MKSACLKVFEICNQNLDNWLYSWSLLKGKFSSLVKGLFERSQKRINSISPCFSLKITLVDQINIEIVLILFRYYLTLFTTIWFFFLAFYMHFFYWIYTRRQMYKNINVQKILWYVLTERFQEIFLKNLLSFLFNDVIFFVLIKKIRKLGLE